MKKFDLTKLKYAIAAIAMYLLSPANALAHTGHSHQQFTLLERMVHNLVTSPLLFGVIGLVLVTLLLLRQR